MAATIYTSTAASDTQFGIVNESALILTSFSRQVNTKKSEIMDAEGTVIAVAFTGKTAAIKLSGFINGSVDLEVANLITLANSTANFGLSGGTLLIDSASESSGQGEFRKVDVDVTQYESTMTLQA
jgi:hypothetical protein